MGHPNVHIPSENEGRKFHCNNPLHQKSSLKTLHIKRPSSPQWSTFLLFKKQLSILILRHPPENYRPGVDGVDIRPLDPESKGRSLIFDLARIPWASWDWGLRARHLLLHLFATAFNLGYQITASADVSSEFATDAENVPISPLDVHSTFLVKMHTQLADGALSEAEEIVTKFGEHIGSGPPTYEETMWPLVWVVQLIQFRSESSFCLLGQWEKKIQSKCFIVLIKKR